MSLMKVAGGCLIGRKLLQGPQFVQKFSGTNSGSRLLNRQIQSQLRYFRGQARDGNGKKVGLVPDVKVAPADQVGKGLAKPIAFTIGFCTCSFAGAAIWQYETMRNRTKRAWERSVSALRDQWSFPNKYASWRTEFHGRWRKLSDAEKLTLGLLGANALVFLLWRVPRLQPMMTKYFCSNPAARAVCWPMVLSTFSHYSFWHLFINMYVLYSFSNGIGNVLGHEQFLAMYLSAGVVSSLASYVHKIITVRPGLSLGASGCLMGVLGFFCMQFPNAELGIVFLPMLTFSAATGLKAIVALDSIGILLGWKLFDHAAHLGGVAFGMAYALWGREYIWERREPFLRWWNELRGSPYK